MYSRLILLTISLSYPDHSVWVMCLYVWAGLFVRVLGVCGCKFFVWVKGCGCGCVGVLSLDFARFFHP